MVTLKHDNSAGPRVRAVRGATTVERDEQKLIHDAVRELLTEIISCNNIGPDDIISAMFTATPDLKSAFPARAARDLGWHDVPMLCATEIDVPGAQPRCLRVMLYVERGSDQPRPTAVYLRDAVSLRPDLAAAATPLAR
jgi:chorismate mutase